VERSRRWRAENREAVNAARRTGPFAVTCADCGDVFVARVRSQARCADCQVAMRRARVRWAAAATRRRGGMGHGRRGTSGIVPFGRRGFKLSPLRAVQDDDQTSRRLRRLDDGAQAPDGGTSVWRDEKAPPCGGSSTVPPSAHAAATVVPVCSLKRANRRLREGGSLWSTPVRGHLSSRPVGSRMATYARPYAFTHHLPSWCLWPYGRYVNGDLVLT
jgi:hypothetical protein